jgi:hypothetical protein
MTTKFEQFFENNAFCRVTLKAMHHPLLISIVSIVLGSFGLHIVQIYHSKQEEMLSRRLNVLEDMQLYASRNAAVLRSLKNLIERQHQLGDCLEVRKAGDEFQSLYDQVRIFESSLTLRVWLYFPRHDTHIKYQDLRGVFDAAVDSGFTSLQAKKATWSEFQKYMSQINDKTKAAVIVMGQDVVKGSRDDDELLRGNYSANRDVSNALEVVVSKHMSVGEDARPSR